MSGKILVVDDVATNRIVMKVKLAANFYEVLQAATGREALDIALRERPDLILLDVMMPDLDGVTICQRLKVNPATRDIPVIIITSLNDRATKMAGLETGADDFLTKPVDETALLARVRALLRNRVAVDGMGQDQTTPITRALSGAPTAPDAPARVALIGNDPQRAILWKAGLRKRGVERVTLYSRADALHGAGCACDIPDVFVIWADLTYRNEGLRLLSELRARAATGHAGIIMVLPAEDSERAAIALDLGAGDIIHEPCDPAELAVRIRTQTRRIRRSAQWRASVRAGLEMALTDPLTSLHNRRYATSELENMVLDGPHPITVMMLDLDHFKVINDRFGHGAGDQVLMACARRLTRALGQEGLLARIGGEEFLFAQTGLTRNRALAQAERFRHAIAAKPILALPKEPPLRVTISIGLTLIEQGQSAPCDPSHIASEMIAAADRALYRAKSAGRNRITLAA